MERGREESRMKYYVICRGDTNIPLGDGTVHTSTVKGKYALVTSRSFPTFGDAETYAEGVAPSREPKILMEVEPAHQFGKNDGWY
jgi:hypothetical protein